MSLPNVVDVCIGLFFIYLLYSLLISILQELIATLFGFRAKILEQGIARMLEDEDVFHSRTKRVLKLFVKSPEQKRKNAGNAVPPNLSANSSVNPSANPQAAVPNPNAVDPNAGVEATPIISLFYAHPLVKFLSQGNFSKNTSYIKRETFSKVIVELISGQNIKTEAELKDQIDQALNQGTFLWGAVKIPEETLLQLRSHWLSAQGNVQNFKKELENWFDEMMERVTGWYKRYTQILVMALSFFTVVLFNVDTIQLVDKLENNTDLRNQVVGMSMTFVKEHSDLKKDFALRQKSNKPAAVANKVDSTLSNHQTDSINKVRYDSLTAMRDKYVKLADSLVQMDLAKVNGVLGIGLGSFRCRMGESVKNQKQPEVVSSQKKLLNNKDCPCHHRGWFKNTCLFLGCLLKSLLGWLITTLAISMGAPFWFDILNKFVKLRGSIAPSTGEKTK